MQLRHLGYPLLLAGRLVLFPLWLACGLLPRRKNLWVFGSWGGYRYADNAAAFFRFCHDNIADKVELVWISRDAAIIAAVRAEGFTAHHTWSAAGMLACARAGIHLFDCFAKDTNFWLGRGAVKINLWSGVPLKVFEREIDNPRSRYYRLFHGTLPERWLLTLMMPWHVERPDLIIATSEETAAITCRSFDIPRDRVLVSGFPRNDVLLSRTGKRDGDWPAPFRAAVASGETIFLYLPTFRDSGKPYQRAIDWPQVDALLARHGARLFCKFHPVARSRLDARLNHVIELPQSLDVYPLLRHARALISDYSSVIFDFMLLGRPIVYFTPDLEEFVSSSRRLNFQPADIAVGPLCRSTGELVEALGRIVQGEDPPGPKQRAEIVRRLHENTDAGASARVLAEIERRYVAEGLTRPATAPR